MPDLHESLGLQKMPKFEVVELIPNKEGIYIWYWRMGLWGQWGTCHQKDLLDGRLLFAVGQYLGQPADALVYRSSRGEDIEVSVGGVGRGYNPGNSGYSMWDKLLKEYGL